MNCEFDYTFINMLILIAVLMTHTCDFANAFIIIYYNTCIIIITTY